MEILDLIESAAALPEAERRAHLSRLCPDRPELVEEALEALAERGNLASWSGASWIAESMRHTRTALSSIDRGVSEESLYQLVEALRARSSDVERFESIDVIARGLVDVARGLHVAHTSGFAHRMISE